MPLELRLAFRYSCIFISAMLLVIFIGISFIFVIDGLNKKIVIGVLMVGIPLSAIFVNRRAFSSKLMLLIDQNGITDYRKNTKGEILLWSSVRKIRLSRALYLVYSAKPATFIIDTNEADHALEFSIGCWEVSAIELAKVIESHIKITAPHIQKNWSSDTIPIIK